MKKERQKERQFANRRTMPSYPISISETLYRMKPGASHCFMVDSPKAGYILMRHAGAWSLRSGIKVSTEAATMITTSFQVKHVVIVTVIYVDPAFQQQSNPMEINITKFGNETAHDALVDALKMIKAQTATRRTTAEAQRDRTAFDSLYSIATQTLKLYNLE